MARKKNNPEQRAAPARRVKVGLVQMACGTKPSENLKKALKGVHDAAKKGAQIVCLQELFRSRYFCQQEDDRFFELAESLPGPTTEALSDAARKHAVTLVGSIFERRTDGLYHNTAVVFDPRGELVGTYRKMHIPDDPRFYEKFYFTPGDAQPGFHAMQTDTCRIGTLICWDQWYPEAARLTAMSGAQILFYPTAIAWHKEDGADIRAAQADAWQLAQRAHALANGVFVCATNRVGVEDDLTFWGQSFVADPFGRVIAKADSKKEEVLLVDCDLSLIDWTRRHWPFLRDRRIDAYGGITQRLLDGPAGMPPPQADPRKFGLRVSDQGFIEL
jgi:N-carbamoylputrescine amidase